MGCLIRLPYYAKTLGGPSFRRHSPFAPSTWRYPGSLGAWGGMEPGLRPGESFLTIFTHPGMPIQRGVRFPERTPGFSFPPGLAYLC